MKYVIYQGTSYWNSYFYKNDLETIEYKMAEFRRLTDAKTYIRTWANRNKAIIKEKGWRAEYEEIKEKEKVEMSEKEILKVWCRIEKQ